MVTALLKFSQGATVGNDGEALKGNLSDDFLVANSDNTGVGSWEIQILEVPYGSSTPKGVLAQGNSATPAGTITPDALGGCYRIQLKVWPLANRQGQVDTDIRCIGLDGANGLCAPPPMVWPPCLPDPRSTLPGKKPNEMNFGGQDGGWSGQGADGLVRHAIRLIAAAGGGGVRLAQLVLASGGPVVSNDPGHTGNFFAVDESLSGTYAYSGNALFEAATSGAGLALRYTGGPDLNGVLARLTCTVRSDPNADYTAIMSIDCGGDVIGGSSSAHKQEQLTKQASGKLYTLSCDKIVDVNSSTRQLIKAAFVAGETYGGDLNVVDATMTLIF
jgi:hypothetical protein